jgi:hypothetical protein
VSFGFSPQQTPGGLQAGRLPGSPNSLVSCKIPSEDAPRPAS